MAHFRGTVDGNGGQASRLGTKKSGLETNAASWAGAITTRLWHDEKAGVDMFEVSQEKHKGAGISRVIARGVVGGSVTFHLSHEEQRTLAAD